MKSKQLKKAIIKYLQATTKEQYIYHELLNSDIYIHTSDYDYYLPIKEFKKDLYQYGIISLKQLLK